MARIAVSVRPLTGLLGGRSGAEGKVFAIRPALTFASATNMLELPLPAGTSGAALRPCWAQYNALSRSRKYGVGAWTANVLIDENMRLLRQTPPAPTLVPTVVAAAGPGPTNTSVCFLRYLDMLGGRVGPLSAASAPVVLANQSRAWSNLPTTCPDPSMSHLQGLIEVDGFAARVAWTRQLGVTAVTEAVATGLLAEAAPPDFTDMPLGNINAIYNYSQWIAGNEKSPEKCFRSAHGEPERYEGAFVQTDGEPVVGFFQANNNFIFGSHKRIYRATAFEDTDLGREIEKPDIGLVGHHGNVLVHGRCIVPTNVGIYLYGGSWQFLMEDRRDEWIREYALYRADYDDAMGFFDPVAMIYRFGPVRHSEVYKQNPGDLWTEWILDCQKLFPEYNQGSPAIAWVNFARARKVENYALWPVPGSGQGNVVSGSCDGKIRIENDMNDGSDDGDTYNKKLTIEPPCMMPDPGGSPSHDGNTFHKAWSYMQSAVQWVIEFRGGGTNARKRPISFTDTTTPPSILSPPVELGTRETHILEGCAGDALQIKVTAESPVGVKWSGYGGTYGPGMMALGQSPKGG